jgi:hypothetical protein
MRVASMTSLLLAAGCASVPAVVQDFPPANHTMPASEVRFDWHVEGVKGVEMVGYQLQIAADEAFDQLEVDRVVLAPPVELPLPPGGWWWRVRARYKTIGDEIRRTGWSDVTFAGGKFVRQPVTFQALKGGATPIAAGAPKVAPPAPGAPPPKGRKPKRKRLRGPKVVAPYDIRPSLEGIESLAVATVEKDGARSDSLTREVVLRLFALQKLVILEGSFVPVEDSPVSDRGGDASSPGQAAPRRFVLEPDQPTPMVAPDAVRLARPDAILVVRVADLDVDPDSLPRPPGQAQDRPGFVRFEGGTRVLNATLVTMASGQVAWTGSLYARQGVSDLTLVEELIRRFFR